MKTGKQRLIIFSVGAFGYGLLEVLWRGYTHWSMLTAGGLAFLGLSKIATAFSKTKLLIKAVMGGGLITLIEYVFGLVFNVILKKNVWDYSRLPLNIGGQVCLLFSTLWVFLSMIFIPLSEKLCRRLEKRS